MMGVMDWGCKVYPNLHEVSERVKEFEDYKKHSCAAVLITGIQKVSKQAVTEFWRKP